MNEDYFDPKRYEVRDLETGEILNVDIFVEKVKMNGWQKAYAKNVSEYIKCGDGKSVDVLAYILKEKDGYNQIYGTQKEIAKNAGVSLDVVTRTMRALKAKKLIKLVRNGTYMLDPDVMRNGANSRGVMMFRKWGELK